MVWFVVASLVVLLAGMAIVAYDISKLHRDKHGGADGDKHGGADSDKHGGAGGDKHGHAGRIS